jgi:hypothetical protein
MQVETNQYHTICFENAETDENYNFTKPARNNSKIDNKYFLIDNEL